MPISSGIKRYVAIKRGLGYKFADQEQMLQKYAAFAELVRGRVHLCCPDH